MNVFFDSSALVKRYVEEPGSTEVESILSQTSSLGVSIICYPEIISALCRLKRDRILSPYKYISLRTALMEDLADATICTIAPAVIKHSVSLLENNTLRAMDSLHIGCALVWGADLFVSADVRQIAAAKRVGLNTQCL